MFTILFAFGTFVLWLIVFFLQKFFIEDLFYDGRSRTFRRKAKKSKSKKENLTLSYILKEDCNPMIKINVFLYWLCIPYGIVLPITSTLVDLEIITSEVFKCFNFPFLLVGSIIIIQGWVRRFIKRYR